MKKLVIISHFAIILGLCHHTFLNERQLGSGLVLHVSASGDDDPSLTSCVLPTPTHLLQPSCKVHLLQALATPVKYHSAQMYCFFSSQTWSCVVYYALAVWTPIPFLSVIQSVD